MNQCFRSNPFMPVGKIIIIISALILVTGCGKKEGKLIFPDLNPYEVDTVTFTREKGDYNVLLKKVSSDKWVVIKGNHQFCADKKAVLNFLNMVAYARYADIIKPDNKKAKSIESAKKSVGTCVTIVQGTKKFEFSVKKAGEDYQSSYLLLENNDSCVRCCPYLNSVVNYPLQKWIEKCVFDLPLDKVKTVQIYLNGDILAHWNRRSVFYPWKSEIDRSINVSSANIEKFYSLISKLRIYDGQYYNENTEYGLKLPKLMIKTFDFEGNITQIKVGLQKNSSFYYASRFENAKEEIVLLSSTWIGKMEDILSDILNRKIAVR